MPTINIKTEELKNQFFELINNSQLPISTVYYLFKDIMQELTKFYNEILTDELKQAQEELKKQNENITSTETKEEEEQK